MHTSDILTARLRLIAITPELLHAQEYARHTLGSLLNAQVPPGWPTAEWEPHVYAFVRNQWQTHPHTLEWHRYILLPGEPDTLIGGIGAHPKSSTEADIGYGVLHAWQRHGYATEAPVP